MPINIANAVLNPTSDVSAEKGWTAMQNLAPKRTELPPRNWAICLLGMNRILAVIAQHIGSRNCWRVHRPNVGENLLSARR